MMLAREAFIFFRRVGNDTDPELRRIITEWLDDTEQLLPWLTDPTISAIDQHCQLVHTYDGGIWNRLSESVGRSVVRCKGRSESAPGGGAD
jgi:hypothetical protein